MNPVEISRKLSRAAGNLAFGPPVACVYNPLDYAIRPHELYLERFGRSPKHAVFVGMNPGPWGMAQTGIPFGDVSMVRDWMGIDAPVSRPGHEHPKRPVHGFACTKSEVSGTRFWGWARDRFVEPAAFFERCFVWNYCPLSFMIASGANFTPDKLPAAEREPLFDVCDDALSDLFDALHPEWIIGVGNFAAERARFALRNRDVSIGTILHPSPASPAANRDWAGQVERQLETLGIRI